MATATALYELNSSQGGSTLATAWPQLPTQGVGGQNLDLLQIIDEGGSILLNVDYLGAVHNPAVSPTTSGGGIGQTRIGQFQTRLSSGTTAQLFADAFSNPSQLDIIQVVNVGGNIHYNLSYLGVASGS